MLTTMQDQRFINAIHWRLWLSQAALLGLLTPAFTFWSQAIFALLLLAKLDQIYFNRPVWSLGRSNLLAALIMAVLVALAKQLGIIHLMFHLLLLASILRLLSIRTDDLTDYRQLLWVNYFLVACCFIVHQNLAISLWILAVLALQLQIQYLLFAGKLVRTPWRKLGLIALVFVPIFAGLFVFFPRLPPLWQLPGAKAAQTGLADDMSPGSIEKLVTSDQLAFRVTFENVRPMQRDLYWRAKIYSNFDGSTWRSEPATRLRNSTTTKPTWHYTVITEPHQQRILYSLGQPTILQGTVQLTSQHLVRAYHDVSQRLSYSLSTADVPLPDTTANPSYLKLPEGNNKTRDLAAQLQHYGQPKLIVAALAAHFREHGYSYTLSPTALSGDEIDQFLFESKAGFCSHYAGAAVFILRAAGVPSRVVGGYLGGKWQDDQNYLQVRQRDAHAWVEYFADGYWYRFDPTAVVAPNRLENGLDEVLADAELSLLQQTWVRNTDLAQFLIAKLDDLDFYWSKWIIAFNDQQQNSIFKELKNSWQQLSLMKIGRIVLVTILIGFIIMGLRWWLTRVKIAEPVKLFLQLERIESKDPAESYQHFLQRISLLYPPTKSLCLQLSECYAGWVFANNPALAKQSWRLMRQLVKQVKKQKLIR